MFVVSTVERREYVPETLEFLVKEKDREKTYSFSKPTLLSVVWGRLMSYKNSRHFFLDTILFWQQHAFGFLRKIHLLVIRAAPQKLFPIQPPGWRKTALESTILPMCVRGFVSFAFKCE